MSDYKYPFKPSYQDQITYVDPRYDGQSLGFQIPSLAQSVHHTRENRRSPAAPRSYINPNVVISPVSYRDATEYYLIPPIVPYRLDPNRISPIDDQPISRFQLFRLSEAVVGRILSLLSHTNLAALALVDKDCCQLARTRLFRSVWINFSNTSMALLTALVNEGRDRFRPGPVRRNRWRLGACIRRITVCTDRRPNKSTEGITFTWIETRVSNIGAMEFHGRHMNALELVLRTSVPNLDFLDWRDRVPLTRIMADAIGQPPITRLEIHCLELVDDFSINVSMFTKNWRLRSLLLRVSIAGKRGLLANNFITSLFRLSAPTLEELVWVASTINETYTIGTSGLRFPKLRKLQLRGIQANDETIWSSLILANDESRLTHLFITYCYRELDSFLARRGHIATLSHLSWTDSRLLSNPDCTAFLSVNPQLVSCRYGEPTDLNHHTTYGLNSAQEGHQSLVPIFSCFSFRMLTSLSLVWATTTIPAEALRGIATITALKHLCLSAGNPFGDEVDWRVDHKTLRRRLRTLKQLKWLVLTRDAYAHGNEPLWGFEKPQRGMEIRHRDNMMRYARLFALVLPALEWAHFGQIPMEVERGTGQELMVVPLQEQADFSILLGEMWGERRLKWTFR